MEFFKSNTNINFMRQRKWAAIFSICLFVFSIGSLLVNGLNLGLDFTGGTEIHVSFTKAPKAQEIRSELNKAGYANAVVQTYGSQNNLMIKLQTQNKISQEKLVNNVLNALPGATLQSSQYIGPEVGESLVTDGILAIVVSFLATMAYLAIRFEYRFSISAAVALVHDPILILGIFSFFHIEFSLITLAALLTMLGYSLNDTVVVYDRGERKFSKNQERNSY